jgi:hypothetical protein
MGSTVVLIARGINTISVTAMMITLRNGVEETPGVVVPLTGLTLVCD